MAQTDPQLYDIARKLADRIFAWPVVGHSNLTALHNAAQQIDTAMNATTNQVQAAYPATVLKIALLNYAKIGAPNLTTQQAAIALAFWALEEVGLL
jgi:hypothetical protein